MITAVDSNVILDVLWAHPTFGPLSRRGIQLCIAEGSLIACDVVWAEVGSGFPSGDEAAESLRRLGVAFSPPTSAAALEAGEAWRSYRRRGGARQRVIADFLIGAHARIQADRLLTRDRGFYRTYFKRLRVLDPSRP